MSVIRVTSQMQQFDYLQCKRCNAVLPISAIFCGKCGIRIGKDGARDSNTPLPDQSDIAARYRITSLVRRRPAIQLSFAFDMRLQRLIVLRDIDVSELNEAAKKLAYAELQQEYDLLRRQPITDVTPLIAAHCYEGHLYSVGGWPFPPDEQEAAISTIPSLRPYTLHDLLQSGIGLPKQRIAVSWIRGLALAVERLHEDQIVIGELDPDTIIMSSHDYSGQPALMVSWIPTAVRHTLSQTSNMTYPSNFRAPETLYGQEDALSDVYSLGALLYLLLTGAAPDPIRPSNSRKRYRQRSPRDLNSHITSALDAVVMQALALEPDKRFQSASELGEALLYVQKGPPIMRRTLITFGRRPKSTPNVLEEILVSSDMDNNESSVGKEAQHIEEPNDETIQIRDIQVQLARRYLSGINTGPLSPQEKQTGEATVDEIYVQDKQVKDAIENEVVSDQAFEEISTKKDEQIKKKRRSHKKSRGVNGRASETASRAEALDEIAQTATPAAQVVEVLVDPSNNVPLQEVAASALTEEVLTVSSSEGTAEMQTSSELAEPEQSLEEEAGLEEEEALAEREEIPQEVAGLEEEEVLVEQEVILQEVAGLEEEEALAEQEVVPQEEAGLEEEEVLAEQEVVPQEEAGLEEEEVLAEQEVVPQEEAGLEEEEVLVEREEIPQEVAGLEEEEVLAEREEIPQEEAGLEEEEVLVEREEIPQEEAGLEEEEVLAEREEIPQEEAGLEEEEVLAEREVVPQEDEPQPEVLQEEQVVSTSQALLSQSVIPDKSKERVFARIKDLFIGTRSLLTQQIHPTQVDVNKTMSFLKGVQRFILGEQRHTTMAAALIETPMRIQPTQSYAIRIQIIGRDQFTGEALTGGLSALMDGDIVHIEVRLALYQSYAYMVQQAEVAIPASGYAAEITVPMHPLSSGPSSRRERLQIFFMDKERNPLYEKPFVIELFVSPLVQSGHEGHNVLSIPV